MAVGVTGSSGVLEARQPVDAFRLLQSEAVFSILAKMDEECDEGHFAQLPRARHASASAAPEAPHLNHPANSSFEAEELARDRDEDHVTI
jgi:hypothetical protein